MRHAIGVVAQKSGSTVQATGRENLVLAGPVYGMRGRTCARGHRRSSSASGSPEAGDRLGAHLLGRHAAPARRRRGADPPAAGAVPRRADDRARSGGSRGHVAARSARLANDEGLTILLTTHYLEEADEPAAQRLAIVDRGRSWSRKERPTSSKGELRGDASYVELEDQPLDGEVRAGRSTRCGPLRRRPRQAARCAHGRTAAPARSRPCSPPSRAEGVKVASVTVARPSLDDVYLRYAGRAFSEADEEVKKR